MVVACFICLWFIFLYSKLVDKSDISDFLDNSGLHRKIATLIIKAELKTEEDKVVKILIQVVSEVKIILIIMEHRII